MTRVSSQMSSSRSLESLETESCRFTASCWWWWWSLRPPSQSETGPAVQLVIKSVYWTTEHDNYKTLNYLQNKKNIKLLGRISNNK
jgi:hypothetical protein